MKKLKELLNEDIYHPSHKALNKIAEKVTIELYNTNLKRENLKKDELKVVLHRISKYTEQLAKGL